MHVSARSDYAVRAMIAVAGAGGDGPVTASELAEAQDIPLAFLHGILLDLRRAGLLVSQRGTRGGYLLTRSPDEISVGEILRTVDGELSTVRGHAPAQVSYTGAAAGLSQLWQAVSVAISDVVDHTSLTDLLPGHRRPAANTYATRR
jgi:Rrf2 family protein